MANAKISSKIKSIDLAITPTKKSRGKNLASKIKINMLAKNIALKKIQ